MTRHLSRLVLMGALLLPARLFALGLGADVQVNSALTQPFDAEIELISPTADELGSLKVDLASLELFARYGMDRPTYLSNLDFKISRVSNGRAIIHITSAKPMMEPVVAFVVQAVWARGQISRAYTVLLDPPVFIPGNRHRNPIWSRRARRQRLSALKSRLPQKA